MEPVFTQEQLQIIAAAQQDAKELRDRYEPLSEDHKDLIFRQARSQNGWQDKPVSDEQIVALYDLVKMGSTSMNCCPARFVFIRTESEKERLIPSLAPPNVSKVEEAPVVVIVGYDQAFFEHMPKLFPHKDVRPLFENDPENAELTAFRNGTLQGAYLMMAARALGLDCGPLSGFSNDLVDQAFFSGTKIKSNFLCCLGYGNYKKLFQRLPRFEFEEVCRIL
ncbi:malonic semialdehyde reductase [Maricurvus nonylphenolicus]|uniref:malonic semialdehyde reductase n=1 Tax=Maricurvus nonylphenolicus TaxID=1008307 RepID=UPI0036F36EFD